MLNIQCITLDNICILRMRCQRVIRTSLLIFINVYDGANELFCVLEQMKFGSKISVVLLRIEFSFVVHSIRFICDKILN